MDIPTNTTTKAKMGYHVQFDLQDIQMHDVELLADMSEEDKQLKWYQSQDFDAILADCDQSYQLLKEGEKHPEILGHCYRGLEDREQEEYNAKRQVKSLAERAMDAVLKEQERQQVSNDVNPELLATIYSGYTTLCANRAARQGREDRQAARASYQHSSSVLDGHHHHHAAGGGNATSTTMYFTGTGEMEVQVPAAGSGNSDDEDASSVVSDVSIDPALGSPKAGAGGIVMGRIRRMIDRTRGMQHPKTRTSV